MKDFALILAFIFAITSYSNLQANENHAFPLMDRHIGTDLGIGLRVPYGWEMVLEAKRALILAPKRESADFQPQLTVTTLSEVMPIDKESYGWAQVALDKIYQDKNFENPTYSDGGALVKSNEVIGRWISVSFIHAGQKYHESHLLVPHSGRTFLLTYTDLNLGNQTANYRIAARQSMVTAQYNVISPWMIPFIGFGLSLLMAMALLVCVLRYYKIRNHAQKLGFEMEEISADDSRVKVNFAKSESERNVKSSLDLNRKKLG